MFQFFQPSEFRASTAPSVVRLPRTLSYRTMSPFSLCYTATAGTDVTEALVDQCAKLFSSNYGVWSANAPNTSGFSFVRPGQHVKMSSKKLRSECLSAPESSVVVTCFHQDKLIGHAFATVWEYDGGVVGWVTQLVVSFQYRRRYIATQLIQTLKTHPLFRRINSIGLVSTQPASVHALVKYGNKKIIEIDLSFIAHNARKIFASSPIRYLKDVPLRGSLFKDDSSTSSSVHGVVSCVDTGFYVDHAEPLQVLNTYNALGLWPLGVLPEGHEFLVVIPVMSLGVMEDK